MASARTATTFRMRRSGCRDWFRTLLYHLRVLRYVQIQTTSRCNADCVFCPYVESWHAAHPGQMSVELFAEVLRQLAPFAPGLARGAILPWLMNEPLTDPLLFERIEAIYTAFPDTTVWIATNALALNARNTEALLAALRGRKHLVQVSHHGVDAASLSEIMRVDPERALHNTLRLLRRGAGLNLQVRGLGTHADGRRSYFSAAAYRAYWARLLAREGIDPETVHVDAHDFHDRAGALRRTDRDAAGLSVGQVRRIGPEHPFHCPRVDRWLHVLWDGRLRLCCMDWHGEVALPRVQDVEVAAWLRSDAYRALVAAVTGQVEAPSGFLCTRCTAPGG